MKKTEMDRDTDIRAKKELLPKSVVCVDENGKTGATPIGTTAYKY